MEARNITDISILTQNFFLSLIYLSRSQTHALYKDITNEIFVCFVLSVFLGWVGFFVVTRLVVLSMGS